MVHPDRDLVAEGVVDSRELLPALSELLGHLVWRAHARVALALAQELPAGVDVHAYAVLLILDSDVPHSQQELAEAAGVSRTTMTRVAGDLSARGLVERVRSPADRRSYALTRTAAGAAAAHDWQRHVGAMQDRLTAPFSADEQAELLDLLLRVVAPGLPTALLPALRGSIGFLVSRLHAVMHRDFLALLEPLGLEPRLFGALTAIASTEPVAQAELARLLGVSGARVVQIADALEEHGLIERRRDPADRRTSLLHLRPGADAVLAQARTVADAMNNRVAPLTAAETRRLSALLERFVTTL
ncbi:MarR family winged helix-turn-helix transcriptional regulator [Nocardioides plantarum]|uniref:MarR family winged helix-turn-helix transcriptional regulator n=1 Tax=Nocardioides plantarum TaxID=29299 RepID=A0ABV5KFY5_9ACTN|nr:MarR family transcriptional regulator [Nocardioides plantarum]